MTRCSNQERVQIRDELQRVNVPFDWNGTFVNERMALDALAAYRRVLATERNAAVPPERRAALERLRIQAELYGGRILQIARPEVGAIQDRFRDAQHGPGSGAEFLKLWGSFCDREFKTDYIQPDQVAEDIRCERGGAHPLPTPSVPPVIEALRNDRDTTSDVIAINGGGTFEQVGRAAVRSTDVHVLEASEHLMERRPCRSWDDFWDLHFTPQMIEQLKATDPEQITLSLGLAFPIQTFENPATGRTDGHPIHFADKYTFPSAAPKNAQEATQRKTHGAPPQSFVTTLQEYLACRTGRRFPRIVLTPNDTNTGEVAYAALPQAEGKITGCTVVGTGFNISSLDTNFEAGHYTGGFHFSPLDSIALAQNGGGAADVECLCCAKILSDVFLASISNLGDPKLFGKVAALSHKRRDLLLFDLAYGRAPEQGLDLNLLEAQVLRTVAQALTNRAEWSLATMASAVHKVKGTQVIFGEGGYARNEHAFMAATNRRVRAQCPDLESDLLLAVDPPVTFATEELRQKFGRGVAASWAGTFLYAHGQNLQELQRAAA